MNAHRRADVAFGRLQGFIEAGIDPSVAFEFCRSELQSIFTLPETYEKAVKVFDFYLGKEGRQAL